MSGKKESVCPTVKARKALDLLWAKAHMKGRTWGPKGKKKNPSPYAGTNILLAKGNELASVSLDKNTKRLIIHQFIAVEDTALGKQIKRALVRAKLYF
jgi:hypothetical protein